MSKEFEKVYVVGNKVVEIIVQEFKGNKYVKLDCFVSNMNEKDQQIADLEAKLAERESKSYTLESHNNFLNNECKKLIKEKNQIHLTYEDALVEKKKIIEKIEKWEQEKREQDRLYFEEQERKEKQRQIEHDKQVRKEVLEKVYKVLEQAVPHDLCWSWAVIKKELDQMHGE